MTLEVRLINDLNSSLVNSYILTGKQALNKANTPVPKLTRTVRPPINSWSQHPFPQTLYNCILARLYHPVIHYLLISPAVSPPCSISPVSWRLILPSICLRLLHWRVSRWYLVILTSLSSVSLGSAANDVSKRKCRHKHLHYRGLGKRGSGWTVTAVSTRWNLWSFRDAPCKCLLL